MKTGKFLAFLAFTILIFSSSCRVFLTKPVVKTEQDRILAFPAENIPVNKPVTVYWNKNLIPFIEAENDSDGAFMLGMVHAHLRLGQMEVFRMLAQGRLAEMIGPMAKDIDHSFKILQLDKAVDEILDSLPDETELWVSKFIEGLNWYIDNTKEIPVEFKLLNIEKRKWTVRDLYQVSRLIAADLSWMTYVQFLMLMEHEEWGKVYNLYIEKGQQSSPSFSFRGASGFINVLNNSTKSGSNSLVISSEKSEEKGALIANDPHLGIFAPNMWLLVGYKTPSYHIVGMQIAGLPFMALGRNKDIAWGGTNMRSISSHLYELSDNDMEEVFEKEDTIKTRWWFDRKIKTRNSKYGPLISDSPFFNHLKNPIAINWLGHKKSFEITAFLKANRASNFDEFRKAFNCYAVSGQNMLYADNKGNIGQVLAYRQPIVKYPDKTLDLVKKTDNPVSQIVRSTELPFVYNPKQGFIASANNKPVEADVPIGFQFTGKNRMMQMNDICNKNEKISIDQLKAAQQDVMSHLCLDIKNRVVDKVKPFDNELKRKNNNYWLAFKEFDGNYNKESNLPVAFETLIYFIAGQMVKDKYQSKEIQKAVMGDNWLSFVGPLIKSYSQDSFRLIVVKALKRGDKYFKKYNDWGEMHRIKFGSIASNVPLVGKKYLIKDYGVSGTSHTLMKTRT